MDRHFKSVPETLVHIAKIVMGPDPAHGWPHILRVLNFSKQIAIYLNERIDWRILETAILLHDIGRSIEGGEHHAIKSARFAERLLPGLGYNNHEIEAIVHAIRSHSYSLGEPAVTIEAKILSDADNLDALGAIGIARVIHTGCVYNRSFEESLKHFYEKIMKLPEHMYLEPSKKMAHSKLNIIKLFVEAFEAELK